MWQEYGFFLFGCALLAPLLTAGWFGGNPSRESGRPGDPEGDEAPAGSDAATRIAELKHELGEVQARLKAALERSEQLAAERPGGTDTLAADEEMSGQGPYRSAVNAVMEAPTEGAELPEANVDARYMTQIRERDREIDRLQQQLNDSRARGEEQRTEVVALRQAQAPLRSEIHGLEARARELESERANSHAAIDTLKQDLAEREQRLEALRAESAALAESYRKQVEARDDRLREVEALLSERTSGLRDVTSDLEELRQASARFEPERALAASRVEALDQELAERDTLLERMRADASSLEERYSQQIQLREAEQERLRALLEAQRGEFGELQQSADSRIAELTSRLQPTEERNVELEAELSRLRVRLEQVTNDLADRNVSLETLRAESASLDTSYRDQVGRRDERIAEIEREIADRVETSTGLQRRVAQGDEAVNALRQAAEVASAEHKATRQQLQAAMDEVDVQLSVVSDLEAQLDQMTSERIAEGERNQSLEAEVANVRESLEQARADVAEGQAAHRKQIELRDARIQQIEAVAEQRKSDIESLSANLSCEQQRADQMRATLTTTEVEREQATQQLAATNAALSQAHEMEARQKEQLAEQARAGAAYQEQVAALQEELAARDRRVQRIHVEKGNLAATYDRRLRERELEAERLSHLLESRQVELSGAQNLLDRTQSELDGRVQEVDRAAEEIRALRGHRSDQDARLRHVETERGLAERTVEVLRDELADLKLAHERSLAERELELERISLLLTSREDENARLQPEVARLASDLAEIEPRLERRDDRIAALEAEVERFEVVRENLLRQMHARESEMQWLRRRLRSGEAGDERAIDEDGDQELTDLDGPEFDDPFAEPLPEEFAAADLESPGDDLTRIKGIGVKTHALLVADGVRTFQQLARWTDAEIVAFERRHRLFSGRITREGWVEGAREEHERNCGASEDDRSPSE